MHLEHKALTESSKGGTGTKHQVLNIRHYLSAAKVRIKYKVADKALPIRGHSMPSPVVNSIQS